MQLDSNSLIAARIIAVKQLLEKEANNKEDEQLLEAANQVHFYAFSNHQNQSANDASLLLLRREFEIWASTNGAEKFYIDKKSQIDAFQELWDLALNPPQASNFKSRSKITKELAPNGEMLFREKYIKSAATELYYKQFMDYIGNHLPKLCAAKAIANIAETGLERLLMGYSPNQIWKIHDISVRIQKKYSFIPKICIQSLTEEFQMPVIVIPIPDHRLGIVEVDGNLKLIDSPNFTHEDGSLNRVLILQALNITFNQNENHPSMGCLSNRCSRDLETHQCHLSHFETDVERIDDNSASIKQIIENKIKQNIISKIEDFKESNYDPTTGQVVLQSIVPFYDTLRKMQSDPGFQFHFKDVTGDLIELSVTLSSIGWSATKLVKSGLRAAKMAYRTAPTKKVSNAIRAFMDTSKTSSFLLLTGRELTDFIIPAFTAHDILISSSRLIGKADLDLPIKGLRLSIDRSEELLLASTQKNNLLDNIYKNLAKTWWKRNLSPESLKLEIDARAKTDIPFELYRGDSGESITSTWGHVSHKTLDDYLSAIIRHSARQGGSSGEAQSLSFSRSVAQRFQRRGNIFRINTKHDRQNFRTIENILKYDGPRLVKDGKITAGTLRSAIKWTLEEREEEVFYIRGSIPDDWVEILL
ncbi:hypothetical protein [Burkholderia sp. TSV86]|uniref:hypothetical protein n=1 Tax=Burkholderia sp. TSV86 TaxID=1385594 RepID=UPI0012E3B084|nr:hypothetical protein [Burkholderia sp. TSV86]